MASAQLKQDFDRRVELAELEPATSWVRFTRGASPPFATLRRLSQPSGFRRNPPRPFAVLRRRYSNGWRSPRVAWRLESCVPQHPPEVDQHPDVNVLSVWLDKHLRLSAERHSVPAVRLLVHVADRLEERENLPPFDVPARGAVEDVLDRVAMAIAQLHGGRTIIHVVWPASSEQACMRCGKDAHESACPAFTSSTSLAPRLRRMKDSQPAEDDQVDAEQDDQDRKSVV